jgi:anti-sigma regulatory factor (Ser/Thr protein kinase)
VPLARSWAAGWLAESAVPQDTQDAAVLTVSELVTNAIRQSDDPVRVILAAEVATLTVEVFDTGHRLPTVLGTAPDSPGGRGLQLVGGLCDAWGIREEPDGKTVWARLHW